MLDELRIVEVMKWAAFKRGYDDVEPHGGTYTDAITVGSLGGKKQKTMQKQPATMMQVR
jgi:hypothetical protein